MLFSLFLFLFPLSLYYKRDLLHTYLPFLLIKCAYYCPVSKRYVGFSLVEQMRLCFNPARVVYPLSVFH